jgi:superfamily II DNA/RNA helicase
LRGGRGIDWPKGLDVIFNTTLSSYGDQNAASRSDMIQAFGRTARFGADGAAEMFVTTDEESAKDIFYYQMVEKYFDANSMSSKVDYELTVIWSEIMMQVQQTMKEFHITRKQGAALLDQLTKAYSNQRKTLIAHGDRIATNEENKEAINI